MNDKFKDTDTHYMKKILYIDMDNVLVDFPSAFKHFDDEILKQYKENKDDIPGIFALMRPIDGAIEAYKILSQNFDTYILSTAPWNNPSAWSDKLLWVQKYLGEHAYKRLIISHHKNLNKGDYLVDDRLKNGAEEFNGELLYFGEGKTYKNWDDVVKYLMK